MPKDIREFYRVLDLSPGASLDEIKRAYRQLLQRWHPDHFKPGSVMQTTAEDITKDINEAYNQLCRKKRYLEFRNKSQTKKVPVEKRAAPEPWSAPVHQAKKTYEQGAGIPHATPRAETPPPPKAEPSVPPRAAPAPSPSSSPPLPRRQTAGAPKPPKSPARPRENVIRRPFPWPWRKIAVAAGFLIAVVAVRQWSSMRFSEPWSGAKREVSVALPPPAAAAPAARSSTIAKNEIAGVSFQAPVRFQLAGSMPEASPLASAASVEFVAMAGNALQAPTFAVSTREPNKVLLDAVALLDTFERGDTKARVLAVQGPPDEAAENIFRYGSSLVYFKEGRVTTWCDGRPSLRVFVLPSFEFEELTTFTIGSTKSEVVRIQGLPTNTTRSAFYYGASVVYFDREWVTSWVEVDRRLRARLMPTIGFVGLGQFAGR